MAGGGLELLSSVRLSVSVNIGSSISIRVIDWLLLMLIS